MRWDHLRDSLWSFPTLKTIWWLSWLWSMQSKLVDIMTVGKTVLCCLLHHQSKSRLNEITSAFLNHCNLLRQQDNRRCSKISAKVWLTLQQTLHMWSFGVPVNLVGTRLDQAKIITKGKNRTPRAVHVLQPPSFSSPWKAAGIASIGVVLKPEGQYIIQRPPAMQKVFRWHVEVLEVIIARLIRLLWPMH